MNLQGNILDLSGAFFGGIIVSFSPCVWPLIPITLSFIGAQSVSSRRRGLTLSVVYVLGLAITYSALGLIASLTGKLFGHIANHPIAFLAVGNACIIAGLSFFDVINLNFSGLHLQNKVKMTGGHLSAFILGLFSGLAVSPCTAPVLGTILLYVAGKQNVFYGAALLFFFAYGMGFLLILLGTFSAVFVNLPKSEVFFRRVRKFAGLILILIGEYFIVKAGRQI